MKNKKSRLWIIIQVSALVLFIMAGALIIWKGFPFATSNPLIELEPLQEARHYLKLEDRKVQCQLCFRTCVINDGDRGHCGVRENR